MITDEIVEAIDLMIEICGNKEQEKGMESVLNMSCDFDEHEWYRMDENKRKNWIKEYLFR